MAAPKADEAVTLLIKQVKHESMASELCQLPAAAAAALRCQVADSSDRKTTRVRTTFRGVEPHYQLNQRNQDLT
jgi:hypothetical protein